MEIEFSRLVERVRLSGDRSAKQVYHLSFESDIPYQPGDSLAVFPENSAQEVDRLTQFIDDITPEFQKDLTCQYDIVHPSDALLSAIRSKLTDAAELDREDIKSATVGTLLEHFSLHFHQEELAPLLKKMRPRLYSITSSAAVNPGVIQLIVAEVSYFDFLGNTVYGIASRYLSHTLQVGDQARVSVMSSKFKLPKDDTADVIMVGPGTGVAPFRSFLQERDAKKQSGVAIGRQWLFFGDQHQSENFYYEKEFKQWVDSGLLSHLDLAFSRDQERKIYVQDRMREHAEELWQWIARGAHFYVCGNASQMAVDVEAELIHIIQEFGKIDEVDQFIKTMKREGRYQRDVY